MFKRLNLWNRYFNRKEQSVLLLILVFGFFVRLINSTYAQFWRDEVYIFFTTKENNFINLLLQNHWDTAHPSLYFLFLHFWQKININPIFLRLPSLIVSLLILYLIPVLAKKINPNKALFPFLALFFYSFSLTQLSLNMVARPYPFVIIFMILSMILFFKFFEKQKGSGINYILHFVLINFLVLFSDYSGIWLLISYGVFWPAYFINKRALGKKNLFVSLILTGIVCSILLLQLFMNLEKSLGLEVQLKPWFEAGNLFIPFLKNVNFFTGLSFFSKTAFLIGMAGAIRLLLNNKKSGIFLSAILICPIVFSYIFSLLVQPIFVGRNLLLVNIAVIFGWSYFFSFFENRLHRIILIFILFFYLLNFFKEFPGLYFTDPPYDWKGMTKIMRQENNDITIISNSPPHMFDPLRYYLLLDSFNNKFTVYDKKNLPNLDKKTRNFYIMEFDEFLKDKKEAYLQKMRNYYFGCRVKIYNFEHVILAKCI